VVGKKVKWAGDCSILVGVGGEGREYIESLRGYKTPSNPDVKPSMYFGTGGTKKLLIKFEFLITNFEKKHAPMSVGRAPIRKVDYLT